VSHDSQVSTFALSSVARADLSQYETSRLASLRSESLDFFLANGVYQALVNIWIMFFALYYLLGLASAEQEFRNGCLLV